MGGKNPGKLIVCHNDYHYYSGLSLERPPYGYRLMRSFKRSGLSSGGTENSTLSHAREILYH